MELNIIAPARKFEGVSSTEGIEKLGKQILTVKSERLKNMDFVSRKEMLETKKYFEDLGIDTSKEDLTFDNNTALYTTAVADFVERKVRPLLVAANVIKSSRVNVKGTSAVKIPISKLATAQALPDSGDVTHADSLNYTNATVTLGWVYASQRITYELITQSNVDIIQDQLFELGDAISRKIDSDILAAFETATPVDGSNSNQIDLGASQDLTYDLLMDHVANAMDNSVLPDTIIVGPTVMAALMKDSSVKAALGYNSTEKGTIFPRVIDLFGMNLLVSTQVSAKTTFLVDSQRCGYFLEGSGVEVFDGRISGSTAQEVIAVKLYGVTIAQPEAVYRILDNTAA